MNKIIVGWWEWVSLFDLGIKVIKMKVDIGVCIFVLYVFKVISFQCDGCEWIWFCIYLFQDFDQFRECEVFLLDCCVVMDFGGYWEECLVIKILFVVGGCCWLVEMIFIDCDIMKFCMLFGCIVMDQLVVYFQVLFLFGGNEY